MTSRILTFVLGAGVAVVVLQATSAMAYWQFIERPAGVGNRRGELGAPGEAGPDGAHHLTPGDVDDLTVELVADAQAHG